MVKVIEAISDGNIGGAGILLVSRLKNSDRSKIKTVVVLPKSSDLAARFKAIDIDVLEVDVPANESFNIKMIFKLVKVIKQVKPEIINAHGWLTFRIAALFAKVPLRIYTRHCCFPMKKIQTRFFIKKLVGFFTSLLSHHIIAVANIVKKDLVNMGINEGKISVIINGSEALKTTDKQTQMALKSSLGISNDTMVLCINARLERYKSHECLLRALTILKERNLNIKCLIIGDGSIKEELKQKCEDYKINDMIIFTGFVKDVSPYMNISDINVNCSVGTETSSLALSEGMSLGLPSVVSDFGGNPYMINDGINGFVFPQGRADILAEKIFLLSQDKSLYKKMSVEAKKRFFAELNSKRMTELTEALYIQLLNDSL